MFGQSLLPPAEVCDCFALEFLSNLRNDKRVEQFGDYLLENCIDADSTFPPPVWSECTASSLRTINACESFHAHFNALFYSAHPNIFVLVSALKKYRMRHTSKWEASLHEDLKNQLHSKKRTSSPKKLDSIELTWCQEPNLFHQCRINFYQTHTCSSLFLAFTMPLATSVTVQVIAQKITDTTHVKPQWAKRFEVGSYTF